MQGRRGFFLYKSHRIRTYKEALFFRRRTRTAKIKKYWRKSWKRAISFRQFVKNSHILVRCIIACTSGFVKETYRTSGPFVKINPIEVCPGAMAEPCPARIRKNFRAGKQNLKEILRRPTLSFQNRLQNRLLYWQGNDVSKEEPVVLSVFCQGRGSFRLYQSLLPEWMRKRTIE